MVLELARDDTEKSALPGTFLHEGETPAQAAERSLRDRAGVHGLRPRQLHVFDAPDRPRERIANWVNYEIAGALTWRINGQANSLVNDPLPGLKYGGNNPRN